MKTEKYNHLFIDLDNTLWDTDQNLKECLEDVFVDYGYNRYYATFDSYYNVFKPINDILWDDYHHARISKEDLMSERFLAPLRNFGVTDKAYAKSLSDDFLQRTTTKKLLIEGAIELLEYLRPKYTMSILSNGFSEVQYKKLENSGLDIYFDDIVLSDKVGVNKPDPEIFNYALKSAGAKRDSSLMIGDSLKADMKGAYNSEIDQIWFNPSRTKADDFTPTYSVVTLSEIHDIL